MFCAGISSSEHEIPVSAKKRRNRNDKREYFDKLLAVITEMTQTCHSGNVLCRNLQPWARDSGIRQKAAEPEWQKRVS